MRYEGALFRPPSEATSYILQATIGCSWNNCTYCDMYRAKSFSIRPLAASLEDIVEAGRRFGPDVDKVFVADGDALIMGTAHWLSLLRALKEAFPRLRRVSCYAMSSNVRGKEASELSALAEAGLTRLYIGPETGDDVTMKRIAKGGRFEDHVEAADRAHAAGMELSVIAMLGVAGVARSAEHAEATARLVTAMDPAFFAALTTTIVPGTPLAKLAATGRFQLPSVEAMLGELRTMVDQARPTSALFRTNHASNYLALKGRLPDDREAIVGIIDRALSGAIPLRPEATRGL